MVAIRSNKGLYVGTILRTTAASRLTDSGGKPRALQMGPH
jgi:hypothetical protein